MVEVPFKKQKTKEQMVQAPFYIQARSKTNLQLSEDRLLPLLSLINKK